MPHAARTEVNKMQTNRDSGKMSRSDRNEIVSAMYQILVDHRCRYYEIPGILEQLRQWVQAKQSGGVISPIPKRASE